MLPIAPTQVYAGASIASFGMAPLVYLIGMIAMFFTALSYSKMTREFPIAGSAYSFVQRGMNPHIGFLTGWLIVLDYIIVPGLLVSFSTLWLSVALPEFPSWLLVVVFIAIMTFVNVRGIEIGKRVNQFFLFGQISLILIFIICAIKFVFIDNQGTGGFSLSPFWQSDKIDMKFIASAASIAMLGFIGFDAISTLSEETKDPTRTVGKSVIASLVLIGLLFMGQAYMATLAHPDYTNLDADMGYFDIIREVGGDVLYYTFIIAGVIFVGVANALTVQSAISRVLFSTGRDKVIPFSSFFGKVHPKYKTPANATLFVGSLTVIIGLFISLDLLVRLVNFGAMSTYMLLNLSVITYFFFKKKQRSIKQIFGYLLFPLIGFLVIGFIWTGFDRLTYTIGFSWLIIGLVIIAVQSKGFKEVPPALKGL